MKMVLRVFSILITILSIIAYFILQEPFTNVTLEDYTSVASYEFEYISNVKGEKIYLYADANQINNVETDFLGTVRIITNREINQLLFQPTAVGVEHIKFRDYTTFYYPEFKGYQVIGSVEFDRGKYEVTPMLEDVDLMYSTSLPVEVGTSYAEYATIPIITGIFGAAVFLLTLLHFHQDYDNDEYQQGYQKPQRGKRERY